MSENKRYYWYKMKTDFFDEMIVKFLRLQNDGDTLVILFQQIMLYSLKTDGYLTYKEMLGTFADELALAINAKADLVKKLLDILLTYGAMEVIDEHTFYIRFLEDCVGSETRDAIRKRDIRKRTNEGQCPTSDGICPPEIEKETEKSESRVKEDKDTSTFFSEKKSGSVNAENMNFSTDESAQKHNSTACKEPPRNYEIEAFLKKRNLTYEEFMPDFVK